MIVEIRHRYTGSILWSGEAESLRQAVEKAVSARADLAGADLAGADLAYANLAYANLAYADLLADANLADADLAYANLLAGANLAYADLADADLADADLADARNVPMVDSAEARSTIGPRVHKTRQERAAEYRARHPEVPVVESLDAKILERIESGAGVLDMSSWHSCETTHCRAGWAIHLAGLKGYELEKSLGLNGTRWAGAAIYRASTGRVPHFFANDRDALADIRRCAAEDASPAESK